MFFNGSQGLDVSQSQLPWCIATAPGSGRGVYEGEGALTSLHEKRKTYPIHGRWHVTTRHLPNERTSVGRWLWPLQTKAINLVSFQYLVLKTKDLVDNLHNIRSNRLTVWGDDNDCMGYFARSLDAHDRSIGTPQKSLQHDISTSF